MTRKLFALLLLTAFVTAMPPQPAGAAGTPIVVSLDGRPLSHRAYVVNDHIYVNAVDLTKGFAGLMVFQKGGGLRVNIGGSTAEFYPGRTDGLYNGKRVLFPVAPFVQKGDLYVPLYILTELAGVESKYYPKRAFVNVRTAVPAQADASHSAGSPALTLRIVPGGSVQSDGLHMTATLTNVRDTPYTLRFNSSKQLVFQVNRDGTQIYDSGQNKRYLESFTTLRFAPGESKTITELWPGFAAAGPGRYTIRAVVMTQPPTQSSAVSIGVVTPAPATSATP